MPLLLVSRDGYRVGRGRNSGKSHAYQKRSKFVQIINSEQQLPEFYFLQVLEAKIRILCEEIFLKIFKNLLLQTNDQFWITACKNKK